MIDVVVVGAGVAGLAAARALDAAGERRWPRRSGRAPAAARRHAVLRGVATGPDGGGTVTLAFESGRPAAREILASVDQRG